MNNTVNIIEPDHLETEQAADTVKTSLGRSRGRPRLSVRWPEGQFTFDKLNDSNVLSSSSLRKKMRAELVKGGLVKVGTLKATFGRPKNLYAKQLEQDA